MPVGNHLQMGLGRYGTGGDLDRRQSSLCRRDDCSGAFQYVRTDHIKPPVAIFTKCENSF